MSLCSQNGFWRTGIAMYGISDLLRLEETTHRFESGYNQSLLGILPRSKKIWQERSPINLVSKINTPLLLFHGTEDRAVPFEQSSLLYEKMLRQKKNCQLFSMQGEGHGFRDPKSKKFVLATVTKALKVIENS